ncbi:MAG: glycosyltransferase family 4 protein, partial [Parafilimonas sp.]
DVTLVSLYDHTPKHLPLDLLDKKIKFITLGKRQGPDLKIFSRVYHLLEKLKPDVVHTHLHSGYYCFRAYLKIKNHLFKKVHTIHNLAKRDSPWHGRMAYKYFFNKKIIHPVTISEEVFKSAVKEYGSIITTLINNGSIPVRSSFAINEVAELINKLKKNTDTKVLLNIARISKQKNQQLLIECMRTLGKEGENVIALIIGDYAPDDEKLYRQLNQNKPPNVYFIGRIKNVGDYYLNADAFLLSSIFEGLPISLLEALSAGVIPVCTPVGGVKNIVNKDIGFLSADVSYESYLAALKAYLKTASPELEVIKQNGKELYKKEFSIESCAAEYDALYHS